MARRDAHSSMYGVFCVSTCVPLSASYYPPTYMHAFRVVAVHFCYGPRCSVPTSPLAERKHGVDRHGSAHPCGWDGSLSLPGERYEAKRQTEAAASIRGMSSVSHSLDIGKARTKFEGVSKAMASAASMMPIAVWPYRPLDDRWAVRCIARPTMPSAGRPVRWRWMVASGSPRISANSVDSTKGIRARW